MRHTFSAGLGALGLAALVAAPARPDTPKSDFLAPSNWEGLMEYWKIDGDTVVGTTQQRQTFNTFLCSKKKYKDFELSCQVRLLGKTGNSGVQVRSHIHDTEHFAVTGPQADMGAGYWGSLYGEHFGGMMKMAPADQVNKVLKKDDFNDYSVKVVGKHVTIAINGVTTVDDDFPKMPDEGIIAFQIHAGEPMEVTFKNIKFKELNK
jgi:hypothetical protein